MPSKTVKVMRVRPRAAFRDQNDDAARRGMGQIVEVSEKVANNAKLMKREGYVRVTETQEPKPQPTQVPKPEPKQPVETQESTDNADATDAAKTLADEHFIDLSQVTGTGRGGKITKGDIQKLVDNG